MPDPKLTDAQVEQIRLSTLTDTHWANVLGVNRTTVERARTGRTFSHLETPPRLEASPRGGWKKLDLPCDFRPQLISFPNEEWRPVVGWERHYRVSNLGRVYSLHQTGRLITGMPMRGGYRVIKLRDGDRHRHSQVHCLVLEAFVGPRPAGHEGCHNDGNPKNCRKDNLRWDTPQANAADKVMHGTSLRGRTIVRRLTAELVAQIRLDASTSAREWAERLGVTEITVFQARTGKSWKHVDTPAQRRRA